MEIQQQRQLPVENTNKDLMPSISIDYRSLFYRLKKNWYWFIIALIVFIAAAFLRLRYTNPQYTTSATFILEDASAGAGVSTQQFSRQLGFEENSEIDDELNVLTSRTLMAKVVRELGLNLTITHQGNVRNTLIYKPQDFSIVSIDTVEIPEEDVVYGSVDILSTPDRGYFLIRNEIDTVAYSPGAPFEIGNKIYAFLVLDRDLDTATEDSRLRIKHSNPISVAGGMLSSLSAQQLKKSNTIQVVYNDIHPMRAADVVNTLLDTYNGQVLRERSLTGEQTVRFIDNRLEFVTRELYSVESSLSNLRQQEGIIVESSLRGSDYLSRLSTADAQLSELEVRRSLIEELQLQLTTGEEEFQPISVASEIIDGTLAQLVNKYNELIFEREQKLEAATVDNPTIVTFSEQLLELKRTLIRSINTLYRETSERVRKIESRIKPIEEEMQSIPDNERQLLQVQRQQQIKQDLFVYLMEKREEAAISVAAQVPNTRVVDPARPRATPINPKPTQNYAAAIGLALFLPALLIFLREAFNTKIQMEKDVSNRTRVPIIGRIASSSKGQAIVVSRENRSGAAEMFRILRTNLNFLRLKTDKPVMLLTSSVSGEGKTFVAANLGLTMALAKKKTVIVGADMRKPGLSDVPLLQANKKPSANQPGLSNFLIGEASYEDILERTDDDNLFVINSGPIPPDPSELLLQPAMEELIIKLREDFDVILIDAPPVGLVADALQLAPFVDVSLYVVRLGRTPKASLEVLDEMSGYDKLPKMRLVVNGLQPKRDYGYGYAQDYYIKD